MSDPQTTKLDELFRSVPKNTGINPELVEAARTEYQELKFKAGVQVIKHKQQQWSKPDEDQLQDDIQNKDMEIALLRRHIKEIRKGNNAFQLDDASLPLMVKELYLELTNKEWADLFCYLKERSWSDIEIIVTLQRILRASYLFCHDVALEQLQNIEGEALYPSASWMDDKGILTRTKINEVSRAITKLARQYQRITAQECLTALQKTFKKHVLPTFIDLANFNDKVVHFYTNACVEVTWYMCVLDPPMTLIDKINRGSKIDIEYFQNFRNASGTRYDYMVMPAVLLHSNGPLVVKGTVQPIGHPKRYERGRSSPKGAVAMAPARMKQGTSRRDSREDWVDLDMDSDGEAGCPKGVTPPQVYVKETEKDDYMEPSSPYVEPYGPRSKDGIPTINILNSDDEDPRSNRNTSRRYRGSPRRLESDGKDLGGLTAAWKGAERKTSAP